MIVRAVSNTITYVVQYKRKLFGVDAFEWVDWLTCNGNDINSAFACYDQLKETSNVRLIRRTMSVEDNQLEPDLDAPLPSASDVAAAFSEALDKQSASLS